ncbi:MAG: hypothetical protein WCS43_17215, partial [Verrucomicrobiota bacterium]
SEDRGRPASEITNQIDVTRKISTNSNGHIHWSAKSLVTNRGGIATKLANTYTQPSAIPAMPWVNNKPPGSPGVSASAASNGTTVAWVPDERTAKIAIQAKTGGAWRTVKIAYLGANKSATIPRADVIAVTALDRYGNASPPKVLGLR